MILEFKVKCRQGFDRGKVKRVRRGLSPAWCSSSFDKVGCFLGLGKLGCSLGQQWYSGMLLTTMVLMFCLALVFMFGSTEQPLMIFVIFVTLSNWPWSWWNFVQDLWCSSFLIASVVFSNFSGFLFLSENRGSPDEQASSWGHLVVYTHLDFCESRDQWDFN